ncbi:MAG: hypothetical protein A3F72_07920 [Bacteroidetes bacterium RIFCSPLOWO2_12_FULL_35_15]|nr:MAG: hypothetical protein A3F72_07920 [Bacteroidetes bacterium RIFCSPLOWO2_12_FULL_35_15]
MPGRNFTSANGYRYGYNGKEKDDEVKGAGNSYNYGFRIYDPRIGRFLSVDPLSNNFAYYTPYQYAGNKPIAYIDLDGLEDVTFYEKDNNQYMKIVYNAEDVKKLIANNPKDPVILRVHYKSGIVNQFKGPNVVNEKKVFNLFSKQLAKSIIVADAYHKAKKAEDKNYFKFTNGGAKDDILVPKLEKAPEIKGVEPNSTEEPPKTIKYIIFEIDVNKADADNFLKLKDNLDYVKAQVAAYKAEGYDEVKFAGFKVVDKLQEDSGASTFKGEKGVPMSQAVILEKGEKEKK